MAAAATLLPLPACTDHRSGSASVSPAQSSVSVTPSAGVTADGTDSATITVVVRDANGNPLPNQTVSLSATRTGNTITPNTGTTDANGTVTATITSIAAEMKTINVIVDPSGSSMTLAQVRSR